MKRSYTWHYLIRITLLVCSAVIFGKVFLVPEYLFSQIIILSLIVLLSVELLVHVKRGNEKTASLLLALKHKDKTAAVGKNWVGAGMQELEIAIGSLLDDLNTKSNSAKEEHALLRSFIEAIPQGLIIISNGKVLVNRIAESYWEVRSGMDIGSFRLLSSILGELIDHKRSSKRDITIKGRAYAISIDHVKTVDEYTIISFAPGGEEAENAEMDAWLRLIRIMTHEIMNSVTSITSLSATALDYAKRKSDDDLSKALTVIHNRADGLKRFVKDYRTMSHVPAPTKQWFCLRKLTNELAQSLLGSVDIEWEIHCQDEKIKVYADEGQMEQVITNILLNARHAIKNVEHPKVSIEIMRNGTFIELTIQDNGLGVDPSNRNDIFIPFFSTKDEGSGIGLSLSRQIMRSHEGNISLLDSEEGAKFILRLREGE